MTHMHGPDWPIMRPYSQHPPEIVDTFAKSSKVMP